MSSPPPPPPPSTPAAPAAPAPAPDGAGRLRLLAALVAGQGVLMLGVGIVTFGYVIVEGDSGYQRRSDAVVSGLGVLGLFAIWGVGLLLTARAAANGRRWSFSVILFTEMMWGLIFVSSLKASAGLALAVDLVLLAWVVAILALLFHPDVRYRLGRGPRRGPAPGPTADPTPR